MKRIRVCVLVSSYDGSDSELKQYEGDLYQTPQNYFSPETDPEYEFTMVEIKKATAYRQIRQLVKSGSYDIFYNQCDGAKDEDRAGVEVVQALEEFHAPFTGAISKYYELTKAEMKMVAHYYNIKTANFAVVEPGDDIAALADGLRYPLIIKHISGYSSVGMDKTCKVFNVDELVRRTTAFLDEFQCALVEEFINGDEATILACSDESEPDGVRVFHPVQVNFPAGEDFKHFHLKWAAFEGMNWIPVARDDPALPSMLDMARRSFKKMMGGIGYGRIDVRIDRERGSEVVFLEINPNCGIMYPVDQEGSADWILKLSPEMKQNEFAKLQIREAMRVHEKNTIVYERRFDHVRGYHLRALMDIAAGTVVFADECRPVRLCTKPYVEAHFGKVEYADFCHSAWPIGVDKHYYALWDHDPGAWRSFNHSCSPNMSFAPNRSLNVVALRLIKKGEEMTMDYRQFMDDTMKPFKCFCGSANCAKIITPGQAPASGLHS